MYKNFKTMSGSDRDKSTATSKQNKWNDPFFAKARGVMPHMLHSHKVDSIRKSSPGFDSGSHGVMLAISKVASFARTLFSKRKVGV